MNRGSEPEAAAWTPAARQTANLGGTLSTLDGLRGPVPLPDGLLSRDGWYLIDDTHGHRLEPDGGFRAREAAPGCTDWYLFAYGQDYRAALAALAAVSGPVPLPRRPLLGSWYSRYWPHTSEEFRAIVRDYAEHGFPLDVVVLDMDWHRDGWTGWSWNRDLLPDAEELLRWFHAQGLAVTLNLHPADGVGPHEDRYGPFMRALGRDPASHQTIPFDAGSVPYMRALFEHVLAPLERDGVDFWWVDWQQEKFVRSVPGLTNLQALNHLFHRHTAAGGRRGVSFSRWAGDSAESRWGDHRHPIHFSGDAHTGWDMLSFQVPFTAAAGNVGCFFWSHDIGGHFGPRIEEATARWVQFGALSAALRLHSARTGVLDRRPWTYPEPFRESMRCAFVLRAELMEYIYSAVHHACRHTVPLVRPMYIDSPGEERAYCSPHQYMLGSDLLVAPIVSPGRGPARVATQAVWFPPSGHGAGWRRFDTGERFAPGDEAIVAAEIREVPLFVREGVPVVLRESSLRMTQPAGSPLRVRLWPGVPDADADCVAELVEDDGISADPSSVSSTFINASWHRVETLADGQDRRRLRLQIRGDSGRLAGTPASGRPTRRAWIVELAGVLPDAAVVGSTPVSPVHTAHDPSRLAGLFTIALPEAPIDGETAVVVEFTPAPTRQVDAAAPARRFDLAFPPTDSQRPTAPLPRRVAAACAEDPGLDPIAAADALAIGAGIGLTPCDGHLRLIDTFGWADDAAADVEISDTIGPRTLPRSRGLITLHAGQRSRGADVRLPDQPLQPPPLGLRASRWVNTTLRLERRPVRFAVRAATLLTPIPASAWRALGPFPWDWRRPIGEQVFSPEHPGGDRARSHIARGQTWHDTGAGSWVTWCPAGAGERWPVDFRASLSRDSGLAYGATTVTSSRRQQARLVIDSSDKLELWLNGERVFSQDGFDTQAALEGGAACTLLQGRNSILVKCASGGGGWGFSLAIDGQREVAAEAELDPGASAPHPTFG